MEGIYPSSFFQIHKLILPFHTEIVNYVIGQLREYHETGSFLEVTTQQAIDVLEFTLFIGFYKFFEFILPEIAQNITDIPQNILHLVPTQYRNQLIQEIPISSLNPDFIIDTYGLSPLLYRLNFPQFPKQYNDPFRNLTQKLLPTPTNEEIIANGLVHFDTQFLQFPFIKKFCTRIYIKKIINILELDHPQELILEGDGFESPETIIPILHPMLKRLEIIKVRLKPQHIIELINYISQPNCSLEILSIRQVHLQSETGLNKISYAIQSGCCKSLKFLDVGDNNVGSDSINKLLVISNQCNLMGISVDSNFFQPNAELLSPLITLNSESLSIAGLHWDNLTTEVIKKALQESKISFWNLSAQTVHMHSDPDLSTKMAENLLNNLPNHINFLYFSNHKLSGFNLEILANSNLKHLALSNSSITNGLAALVPLISRLELLDLSNNNIQEKSIDFLTACATSPSLRFLFLSNNNLDDSFGSLFFDCLTEHALHLQNQNQNQISQNNDSQNSEQIQNSNTTQNLNVNSNQNNHNKKWVIRMRNCGLTKKTSISLIKMVNEGCLSFTELDIGGNKLFHLEHPVFLSEKHSTDIEILFMGNSFAKEVQVTQFLSCISHLKIVEMNRFSPSLMVKIAPLLVGINGFGACCCRFSSENELIQIIKTTKLYELFIINSVSERTLSKLVYRWREIPSLMAIHIGQDIKSIPGSKIPIFTEDLGYDL